MIVAEDYLHLVRDWYDPYDDPIVELHDNVHVVRDDVLPAKFENAVHRQTYTGYRLRRMGVWRIE